MAQDDEDDPVTAEYDIYLTPSNPAEQVFLLQYPNRPRSLPYNNFVGMGPSAMRIKPQSGYLEMDVELNTTRYFNKYQALKWGDAVRTAREQRQQVDGNAEIPPPTYGMAAGLVPLNARAARRGAGVVVKDAADRELDLQNDITEFNHAVGAGKVMQKQTLGGQIIYHTSAAEAGKPLYFVGAFRGKELHLSRVAGTAQMRPQFHHLDAEDQRNRLGGSLAYSVAHAAPTQDVAADGQPGSSSKPAEEKARVVHQTYKNTSAPSNPRGELEEQTNAMRQALQVASEEDWLRLRPMDDDDEEAYKAWDDKMFLQDTERAVRLKSGLAAPDYLDAISGKTRTVAAAAAAAEVRKESPTRVRKKGKASNSGEG